MDTYRWISIVISIILGLGITRLLTSAVGLFLARRKATFDWIPFAWSLTIFVQQIDFWWSIEELSALVLTWWLGDFLLLVGLVLTLFLAAALILPASEAGLSKGLRIYFEEDGRWALAAIALFNMLAIFANWKFWGEAPVSVEGALNLVSGLLPLVALFGTRRAQEIATIAYVPAFLLSIMQLSPASY
jgi:hypothetical protein